MVVFLQSDPVLEQDRATMQFIIIALLIVAFLLGLLTIWYWKQTDPRRLTSTAASRSYGQDPYRRQSRGFDEQDGGFRPNQDAYRRGPEQPRPAPNRPVVQQGPGRRPAPDQPPAGDDPWTSLTSADNQPPR